MPDFIPGLKLSELFYQEAVDPILSSHFPKLQYSAALLGPGSEVLGFDDPVSTDHHWGPRLQLFLSEEDYSQHSKHIGEVLARQLPVTFRGYSTNFGPPDEIGVRLMKRVEKGPVSHRVEIMTIRPFLESCLGISSPDEMTAIDWLTIPEQRLLSMTAGRVYRDDSGKLGHVRQKLAYYPRDIWLYLMAAQWKWISQEEAFVGRTGDAGDELGSRIIAARLVRALMKLCFLMEKQYAPYSKWFGTAYGRLTCSKKLAPIFRDVFGAESSHEREQHLSRAYSLTAEMHNALGITQPLVTKVSSFFNRSHQVIHSERFVNEIRKAINEEEVRKITASIGSIDQFVDCTDIVSQPQLYRRLRTMFEQ